MTIRWVGILLLLLLWPGEGLAVASPLESVTSFNVNIEYRNAQSAWITQVMNLPVSIADASAPAGYLGWGAPGNGKGAAMIAGPGTYRISPQVANPQRTLWSQPIEFSVTTPNKAIQKAPKAFGP